MLLRTQVKEAPEKITDYIALVQGLDDPFNLFLRWDDLYNNQPFIYFFAYSLGRQKVMVWGVYHQPTDTFSLDGGCQYRTPQLATIVREWKRQQFNYVANSVRDRIRPLLQSYVGGRQSGMLSYEEYVRLKSIIAYFDGTLPEYIIKRQFGSNVISDFYDQFEQQSNLKPYQEAYHEMFPQYINQWRRQLDQYERWINRNDISSDVPVQLRALIQHMSQRFQETIERSSYVTIQGLVPCPTILDCTLMSMKECQLYTYGTYDFNPNDWREISLV
jgi:hypothetical protein